MNAQVGNRIMEVVNGEKEEMAIGGVFVKDEVTERKQLKDAGNDY